MSVKIAIDAGHGLYTAGKRCLKSLDPNETREWTLNQRVAAQVVTHLQRCGADVIRLDDVTGKTDVALSTRTNKANRWGANWCVSIHHDSGIGGGSGGGATVYVYSGSHSYKSDVLQGCVYKAFVAEVGQFGNRSRPRNSANFHMVRETAMPAILIECGFMDSTVDTPMILTEDFARKAALGIAKGICNAAGLAWVAEAATGPTKDDTATEKEEEEMTQEQFDKLMDSYLARRGTQPASDWAQPALDYCKDKGIMVGDDTGAMRPQSFVTRQELAQVVMQAAAAEIKADADEITGAIS